MPKKKCNRTRWKKLDLSTTPLPQQVCCWQKVPTIAEHARTKRAVRTITRFRYKVLRSRHIQSCIILRWQLLVGENRRLRYKYGKKWLKNFKRIAKPRHLWEVGKLYGNSLKQMWQQSSLSSEVVQQQAKNYFHRDILTTAIKLLQEDIRRHRRYFEFCRHPCPCLLQQLNVCPFAHVNELKDGALVSMRLNTARFLHVRIICIMIKSKPVMVGYRALRINPRKTTSLLAQRPDLPTSLEQQVLIRNYDTLIYTSSQFRNIIREITGVCRCTVENIYTLCFLGTRTDNALGFLMSYPKKGKAVNILLSASRDDDNYADYYSCLEKENEDCPAFSEIYAAKKNSTGHHVLQMSAISRDVGMGVLQFECSRYDYEEIFRSYHALIDMVEITGYKLPVWRIRYMLATRSLNSTIGYDGIVRLGKKFNIMENIVILEYLILQGLTESSLFNVMSFLHPF